MASPTELLIERNAVLLVALHAALLMLGLVAAVALLVRLRHQPLDWSSKVARLSWAPWGMAEIGFISACLIGLNVLLGYSLKHIDGLASMAGWSSSSLQLIAGSIALQWGGLGVIALFLQRNRVSWSSAFGMSLARFGSSLPQGFVALLATVPVLLFYTALYRVTLHVGGVEVGLQSQVEEIASASSWPIRLYYIVLAAVLAPLVEELLFRGIVLPALIQRMRLPVAICVVSILFAAMHAHVPSLVPLFILSTAFSIAYVYTGTLWVPIVMHGLFNASTVAMLYLLP